MTQKSIPSFKKSDLSSGKLPEIMADRMLVKQSYRDLFWKTYRSKKKKVSAQFLDHFEKLYGFRPPEEVLEWENVRSAYQAIMYNVSDIWNMIAHEEGLQYDEEDEDEEYDPDYQPVSFQKFLAKKGQSAEEKLASLIGSYEGLMFLFTGVAHFGSDGGGDSCWVNLFPHTEGSAEVHRYNHEIGELEDEPFFSISHFVASNWSADREEYEDDYEDEEEDEETPEPILGSALPNSVLKQYETDANKKYDKRPFYTKSLDLFERSSWLLGHSYGDPAFAYAEKLASAPKFKDWEAEKKSLERSHPLAAYWILAHYFMKNENACREACAIAKKLPGKILPALAKSVLSVLDGKSDSLGRIAVKKLQEIREQTFRNCDPKQIEPENRKLLEQATGLAGKKKISSADLKKRIQKGDDPAALIEEFSEDVDTHDFLLKEIGKKDQKFGKLVEEYFRERTSSSYNEWPYNKDNLDRRLSLPVSAAFRQGLNYDSENKKAFAGIIKTMGKFDDLNAMNAFRDAIQKLKQDDKRLEEVIGCLLQSDHDGALPVLTEAAWKFFETLDGALEKKKKVESEGPNLNNIFTVFSYLQQALNERLLVGDEEAGKLAGKVLTYRNNLGIFGIALGYSFAVSAKLGFKENLDYIRTYLEAGAGIKGSGRDSYLQFNQLVNLSEGSIAWGVLDPETARSGLKELLERAEKNSSPGIAIDLQACYLSGLLFLEPDREEWIQLGHRILGNKGEEYRVYGPIRAVGKAKIQALKPHLYYHVYADPNPMVDYTWTYIEHAARHTWIQLTGKELPPFDDDDEYANRLAKNLKELPAAILKPEKYSIQHVFQNIKEKKYKDPDVIKIGGPWLEESLRYSGDEYRYGGNYDRWEAMKALFIQGVPAIPSFAKILELPHARSDWKLYTLQFMRFIEPESAKWEKILFMDADTVQKIVDTNPAEWAAWGDLLAAKLVVSLGKDAFDSVLKLVKRRLEYASLHSYSSSSTEEALAARLPAILNWFGRDGEQAIEILWKAAPKESEVKYILDSAARKSGDSEWKKLPELSDDGIELEQWVNGRDYGPRFWISLHPKEIRFGIEEFYLHSILENSRAESSLNPSVWKDEFQSKAEEMWKMSQVLGYQTAKKKVKKKR
ncbi:hypothetical protein CH379_011275 [Leptospira ellisii]|uniref:Uncharacterized protein n=1 Tax=Leptospira ellisii TaxID=2023197 RepID=A0A2N0BAF8_9LEPT|nr:hypothetical protein [Leptospira ellisii]MDV6236204.1 hypothetical protein [Leptospira ellisii]PJZ93486.1 hypothetical protein CH379_07535 [Leptospira ellisii]